MAVSEMLSVLRPAGGYNNAAYKNMLSRSTYVSQLKSEIHRSRAYIKLNHLCKQLDGELISEQKKD